MLEQLKSYKTENRSMENYSRICRFCLFEETDCEERPLTHLFLKFKYEDMVEKIQNCLNIKLSPNDKIPPIICQSCVEKVNYFSDFIELCSKSEKQLKSLYGLDKCDSTTSQDSDHIAPSVTWISDERIRTACKTESDFSINYKPRKQQEHKLSKTLQRGKSKVMLMTDTRKPKERHNALRGSKSSFSFKCQVCKKKFSSIYDYQEHTKTVHQGDTIYKCGKCDKIFLDQEKCREHENNHKVQCKICSVQVLAKNMGMHLHKHADKFRTKPTIIFKSPALVKNPNLCCKICRKTFKTENRLSIHIRKMHETRKIRFSAKKKKRSSMLKFKIRLKRLIKAQSYKCKYCDQQFPALKQLQGHMLNHNDNKKNKCPICKKQFLYKKHFQKHILQCFYAPSQTTLTRTSSLPNI